MTQTFPLPKMTRKSLTLSVTHNANFKSRLMTFRPPTPSPGLIRALAPINRWLMLGGIPGLRSIPGLGSVPGVRGTMNIPELDFPTADQQRLAASVNETTAAFITPNHPEFLTDWLLDKEVLSRAAPLAACWATHDIVNGLGPAMQKFWLKNNLIAQIPGAGGQAGKDYSVSCARRGNGVLLHPEGLVGWHGDYIGSLFSGAAEMALETARRISEAGQTRLVYIAPVVWKLFFTKDVTRGLHKELSYIENDLSLPKRHDIADPATRLYHVYDALLARDEIKWQVHPTDAPYFERLAVLEERLGEQLEVRLRDVSAINVKDVARSQLLRCAARWLRSCDKSDPAADEVRQVTKVLTRLGRLRPEFYRSDMMSQEHVAENMKRVRGDYCRRGRRNSVHNLIPIPVGPRRAVIRVPEHLEVSLSVDQTASVLTERLRERMQDCLDDINVQQAGRQKSLPHFPNPFL